MESTKNVPFVRVVGFEDSGTASAGTATSLRGAVELNGVGRVEERRVAL